MMHTSRKEKSLAVLCQRFLSYYPMQTRKDEQIVISLDQITKVLNVERRRMYDIVNVLESVEIVSRLCKNQYRWHGFSNLDHTLSKLKTLSVKSDFLNYIKAIMASQLDLHNDLKQATNISFEKSNMFFSKNDKFKEMKDAGTQTLNISREEKSLGIMAQKFLMLFLTSENGLVSINFGARVLLGDGKKDTTESGHYKTKTRRLYDIANILSTIGLIEKYTSHDMNITKPAYKYIGPEVDILKDAEYVSDFMNTENPFSNSKQSLFDHFKRNLDLESIIPKFDLDTGTLTHKEKKLSILRKKDFASRQTEEIQNSVEKYEDKTTIPQKIQKMSYYNIYQTISENNYLISHDCQFINDNYFNEPNVGISNYQYNLRNHAQINNEFNSMTNSNNYDSYQEITIMDSYRFYPTTFVNSTTPVHTNYSYSQF